MEWLSRIGRKNRMIGDVLWSASEVKTRLFSLLPDTTFAKLSYWIQRRDKLNVSKPVSFNEKLWWLRYHYRNPDMEICSDKFAVRDYLAHLGKEYEELQLPLVAYYDSIEDVDLTQIKEEVIFKLNVGSGANMIYDPTKAFDEKAFREFFGRRFFHDYSLNNREWNFHAVKPVLLAERVLRDSKGRLPVDYKFMCFNGKPVYVYYSEGAMDTKGRHNVSGTRFTNVYDMNWEITDIVASYPRRPDIIVEKPGNFEQMKEIAAALSKPFPHVRIDLYNIDGKVYLGEFTFFHSGGCGNVAPQYRAIEMGNMIDIQNIPKDYLI